MENCGRADSLQNENHCRPTVFVYMEVAFKYGADIIRPLSNGRKFMMKINCINEIQLPK